MKIVRPASAIIEKVVGEQNLQASSSYRFLTYIVQQPVGEGILIYNLLTRSIVLLSMDEWEDLENEQDLVRKWFLVPKDFDDKKFCHQVRNLAKSFCKKELIPQSFTILPTTGCNARCFYCFERGTTPKTMSEQIAYDTARFIIRKQRGQFVDLRWFGGEPLYNVKAIDIICEELKKAKIEFTSKMVSNGFLFDNMKIEKAIQLWNLQSVQITLDGAEQIYNKIKNYIYQGINAYQRVIKNIGILLESGINVSIRLNLDKHNYESLSLLIDELYRQYSAFNSLTIYTSSLNDGTGLAQNWEEKRKILKHQIDLDSKIRIRGLFRRLEAKEIKTHCCMADSGRSIIILPDGSLGLCEENVEDGSLGTIYKDEFNEEFIRSYREQKPDMALCDKCAIYPECIRLRKCHPNHPCFMEIYDVTTYKRQWLMLDEYEKYKNSNR